ncbi:uncharacterized protein LOC111643004 [Copidosoma floridanum]|uniref:uncharacterized protein LOC111643004 n=1 Tax=Copidosoma floridanum TaxID=29053 RepID=UPI000C6FB407|nr:uncharacterized protein LOC111643004 [Copidosoma floridanum]
MAYRAVVGQKVDDNQIKTVQTLQGQIAEADREKIQELVKSNLMHTTDTTRFIKEQMRILTFGNHEQVLQALERFKNKAASRGVSHLPEAALDVIAEAEILAEQFRPDLRFPGERNTTKEEIAEISKVATIALDRKIIYYIEIPLVTRESLDLLRISPLPVEQEGLNITNVVAYLQPTYEYVAGSTSKKRFAPVAWETVEQCKKLKKVSVCTQTEPTQELKEDHPCEIRLILEETVKNPEECPIVLAKLKGTYWTRLYAKNQHAFSTTEEEKIHVQCDHTKHKTFKVMKTGVIDLAKDCTAQTSETRLDPSQEEGENQIIKFKSSNLNLKEIARKIKGVKVD